MKRKHISMKVKLAAALLRTGRIEYERSKRMTANQIIALFHWDHYPIPHAEGGPDEPWNLCPMLISEHREKTRKTDVPTIAKGKRIRGKQAEHGLRMTDGRGLFDAEKRHHSTHVMESLISIDEARKLYPDILLPHPDTTAPMPREVYSGRSTKPFRIIGRGFDKTKTKGFDGKVRARKKKSGTRRR